MKIGVSGRIHRLSHASRGVCGTPDFLQDGVPCGNDSRMSRVLLNRDYATRNGEREHSENRGTDENFNNREATICIF
jgi:hypothetical protein